MRCVGVPVALAILAAGSAVAAAEGYDFSRPVVVDRAGWVRVPLDGRTIALAPSETDVAVFDSAGSEIPIRVLGPRYGPVEARTLSVNQVAGDWTIVLDLGPGPIFHAGLDVDLSGRTSAMGCRLEGSDDLLAWTFLTEGDLFRVGAGDRMRSRSLDYPVTRARYLRLTWPESAGFPQFGDVTVRALSPGPGEPTHVRLAPEPMEAGGALSYRLEIPGPGIAIRRLVLSGSAYPQVGGAGCRLFRADAGRWAVVTSRTWTGGDPAIIELDGAKLGPAPLRLDLYGERSTALLPDRVLAEVAPAWIVFHAATAGTYSLAYGSRGVRRPGPVRLDEGQVVGPVIDVEAGKETALPRRAPPFSLTVPIAATGEESYVSRWPLVLDGVEPGGVVRLALPETVLDAVDGDVARLRILTGQSEVPFDSWSSYEPALALRLTDVPAEPLEEKTPRRIRVEDPALSRRVTQVEIFTRAGAVRSPVQFRFRRSARPGVEERPAVIPASLDCGPASALPCRSAVDYPVAWPVEALEVLVEPEAGSAEPRFDLIAWKQARFLVFVWPFGDDLVLASVPKGRRPEYPLRGRAGELLALSWREARVELTEYEAAREHRRSLSRIALIATLILTSAGLIWILARNLSAGKSGGSRRPDGT